MSKTRRKPKRKPGHAKKPRTALSPRQQSLLQQSVQAHNQGNFNQAENGYRSLIAEKIRLPQVFFNLALLCAASDRQAEAQRLWARVLETDTGSLQALENLLESYLRTGKLDQAVRVCERFVGLHPGVIPAKYRLANLYKAQGKFEQATTLYQEVMRRQPDYTQAHFTFSGVHRYRDRADPHIATMTELYRRDNLPVENRIHLAFALAKAFEDLGDFARAFEYLSAGNRLRHEGFQYTIDGDAQLIRNIIETFSEEALARVRPTSEASNRPIFIVGMPRSGTSLVEKILSSHPDVHGAGELQDLYGLGVRLFMKPSLNYQFDALDSYPTQAFEQLAAAYLRAISALDDRAPRVTDKLPLNFMMIGLIRLALPAAKIIHCARDARDTCLSLFRQNFTTDNIRFAYDQQSIARFHKLYRALMEHWHRVFPGDVYDVHYESLTGDPEPEIRRLLAACDLDWHDACLEFHKTPGNVSTASFFQVRQPIYTSSINLWRKYEGFLQPMLRELDGG